MRRLEIDVQPKARDDIVAHAVHIAQGSPERALEFIARVEAMFAVIAEAPGIGRPRSDLGPGLDGLRSIPVRGAPNHLIFYSVDSQSVCIVRVVYGARDLGTALRDPTQDPDAGTD